MPTRNVLVVDTNLFISAIIHPERTASNGLQLAVKHFDLAVSADTLVELLGVPLRPYLDVYANREVRTERVEAFRPFFRSFEITEHVIDCKDKKDNMFLSLALSANAVALVSGDKRDLLSMHPYRGLPIITMREFIDTHQNYVVG